MVTQVRCCLIGLVLAFAAFAPARAEDVDEAFFEKKIRPVLAETCFRCHGGQKTSGQLRVDSAEALSKGGESGPSLVAGKPDESLLLKAIRREEGVSAMPPDKPLPRETVADFAAWIKAGAKWPAKVAAFRTEQHWAFVPPEAVVPPSAAMTTNPIDRFLRSLTLRVGSVPNAPDSESQATNRANKRTLIRRVTFDLIGLPPTPDEVADFLADESPAAFERVVDRLLASPHYGEKWARLWLDVVRYADTAGETADFPAPHAWRYRNYVINAFNSDKPYDEFLREQVAGDLLAQQISRNALASGSSETEPDASAFRLNERYAELITATGYLSISRRFGFDLDADHFLTIDDTVDVLGKSVLGLSIGCARCHDHKYDPISVRDYYGLYGIFESTRYPFPGCEKVKAPRDMVPLMSAAEMERSFKPYQERLAKVDAELKLLNDGLAANQQLLKESFTKNARVLAHGEFDDGGGQEVGGEALNHIEVKLGEMLQLTILPRANNGADSTLIDLEIADVGGAGQRWNVTRDLVDDFLAGNPHADKYGNGATWFLFDVRNGPSLLREPIRDYEKNVGMHFWRSTDAATTWASAWVNSTSEPIKVWSTLAPKTFYLHPASNGPVALGWLSPIDGIVRVSGRVSDAHHGGGDGVGWRLEHVSGNVAELLSKPVEAAPKIAELSRQRTELLAFAPKIEVAYAVAEGQPHDTKIHLRGDPKSLGDAVPRRFLSELGGQAVPPDSGSGRLQLAEWLTSRDNPLTARVMVNRIWKHHFGTGLVKTPNDFGTRGEPPTHPELLDWLAVRFMESGWSIKAIHRLMVTSEAWRKSGELLVVSGEPDKNSPLVTHNSSLFPTRRRLTAEELRDAILAVSGDLDRSPGGPHPFPDEKTWGFTQHNPFAAVYEHDRRSVYLMLQRIKRHPLFALFDGPDTATSTPDRFTTTVPTQALFFLNDPFVHAKSESFARRLQALPEEQRFDRIFALLFSRPITPDERDVAKQFLSSYQNDLAEVAEADRSVQAWAAWLRVLLSSNEFLYVD
jgi:cytochrome c553